MNQFNKFKDFVHGNLSKNERPILSNIMLKEEKHVENIKSILTAAEKKLSNSLISLKGSTDSAERKTKKFPSASLNKFFNEASETLLTSKNDSVLSKTLLNCSQLQNEFTNILAEHENNVEKNCLSQINKYITEDLPLIHRSKKQLNKANEELKAARTKYESAVKANTQSIAMLDPIQSNKVEQLKKEVEFSEHKLEQFRDSYEIEMFEFLSKELSISEIFFQYIKYLEIYHENMLQQIRHYIPALEGVLTNTSQKPVFGVSLEDHLRATGRKLSIVIDKSVEFLLPYVQEEGLFRIPGSLSKVKRIRNAFNAGRLEVLDELKSDAPAVVSTLKSYLRELPEPLLTFELCEPFIEATKTPDPNERLKAIWCVCNNLPEANKNNICYLLKFLNGLTKYSERNKMSSHNLAIALGPSLLWSPGESYDLAMSNHLPTLIEALISYCDYFFPYDVEFNYCSDNSDAELSPNKHLANNNNLKKKPAPKPPSSASQSPLPAESPTGSLNEKSSSISNIMSTSSKMVRNKINSLNFKSNQNRTKPEHVKNIFASENNKRVESPTSINVSTGNSMTYLRHSPETLIPGGQGKIRPKSVCERPCVAPPCVPPRPSLTPKMDKNNQDYQSFQDNVPPIQEHFGQTGFADLNHIDSESEDNSREVSFEEKDNLIYRMDELKVETNFKDIDKKDNNKESSPPKLTITNDISTDKSENGTEFVQRSSSSSSILLKQPKKPPRAHSFNHSSNEFCSSSNTSLSSDQRSLNVNEEITYDNNNRHQRSESLPINDGGNDDSNDIERSMPKTNSSKHEKQSTSTSQSQQIFNHTYL